MAVKPPRQETTLKIHNPRSIARTGITNAMNDVATGERVILRLGMLEDGVRGNRLKGRAVPPVAVVGKVFELVELTDKQIEGLTK